MAGRLEGRGAAVTGGCSGLGEARAQTALFLASDESGFVTGLDRRPAKWRGARRKMIKLGERLVDEADNPRRLSDRSAFGG